MENKLKFLREKRGLTQAAVADFIGISRQMYNKYESGEVEPTLKAVKSLCTLYAVSYEELLGKVDSSKTVDYGDFIEEGELNVATPDLAFGTTNVLAQIMELLPKLLYAEKAKLLTTLAQSMSNDVEAGKYAAQARPQRLKKKEPREPSYEEFNKSLEKSKKVMENIHFNTQGIKWTREELHER